MFLVALLSSVVTNQMQSPSLLCRLRVLDYLEEWRFGVSRRAWQSDGYARGGGAFATPGERSSCDGCWAYFVNDHCHFLTLYSSYIVSLIHLQ